MTLVPLDPDTRHPRGGVPHISMYDLPVPVKERPWRLEMVRSARLLHMAKGAASHSQNLVVPLNQAQSRRPKAFFVQKPPIGTHESIPPEPTAGN